MFRHVPPLSLTHPQLVRGRVEALEGDAAQRRRRRRVALHYDQAAGGAGRRLGQHPVLAVFRLLLPGSITAISMSVRVSLEASVMGTLNFRVTVGVGVTSSQRAGQNPACAGLLCQASTRARYRGIEVVAR